jgi:transcriptional regulator with XRE-family HTH domain
MIFFVKSHEIIKQWIEESGLSVRQIEEETGVNKGTVSKAQRPGTDTKIITILKLLPALKHTFIEYAYLMSDTQMPASESDPGYSLCANQDHARLQIMLDDILEKDPKWAYGIRSNIESLWSSTTGNPVGQLPDLPKAEKPTGTVPVSGRRGVHKFD